MNSKLFIQMTLEEIIEAYPEREFLSADGLEAAVIGLKGDRLVYSTKKIIEILQTRDGMSEDDAWEFFSFNIEGAYVGTKTPIFMD